jgi:hypothetical protein
MLHSPFPVPERILFYGPAGVGKTYAYLKIADWLQRSKSDAKMYILDTDRTVERMLVTEFSHLTNVEHKVCINWKTLTEATREFVSKARAQDWVVCDMIGPQAWKHAQNHFAYTVHQLDEEEGVGEYLLQKRAQARGNKPVGVAEGWDWQFINGVYGDWFDKFAYGDFHALAVAGIDATSENDDKSTKITFGPLGAKPKGQKDLAHAFHTVIMVQAQRKGMELKPKLTTAKDRGRELLDDTEITDFAMGYLVNKAGWKLA